MIESLLNESIINYNKVYNNIYEIINDLNIKELSDLLKNINLTNTSLYIMKDKKSWK